jgi:vacuolar-type H+-ATPase subunit F/Vma7
MSYSPDNVNYKNFKKYFPKGFNSKLIQKKLKQFHSQTDKVQMTLVTQAIKNELGEGVKEAVRASVARFLYIPKKDIKRAIKVVKSMPFSLKGKVEIQKKPSDKVKGFYAITTEKQLFNAVVEFLATADIGVKTISQGKM